MVDRRELRSGAGSGRVGCILLLALLVAGLYVGTPFVRAEMRYRSAAERIRDEANQISADRVSEAREGLLPVIDELGLPAVARRFEVRPTSGGRRFRVVVTYADTIPLLKWQPTISRVIVAETS